MSPRPRWRSAIQASAISRLRSVKRSPAAPDCIRSKPGCAAAGAETALPAHFSSRGGDGDDQLSTVIYHRGQDRQVSFGRSTQDATLGIEGRTVAGTIKRT